MAIDSDFRASCLSSSPGFEPHPARPLYPVTLPIVGPALGLPNPFSNLHDVLEDMDPVVDHPGVPGVAAHAFGLDGALVDGYELNRLRMAVVPQQIRGKCVPNPSVLSRRGEEHSLGDQVCEHFEAVLRFARFISTVPTQTPGSKLNHACAGFTWAKNIIHIRESLSLRIWPARLTGISIIRVRAKA